MEFIAPFILPVILILVGVLLEREFKREKSDRNNANKCSQCCSLLQLGKSKTIDNFIVCDKCYNRSLESPTKERLTHNLKWFFVLSVCGLTFFLIIFQPYDFFYEIKDYKKTLSIWTFFAMLVVWPLSKVIYNYKELKKLREKK